MDAGSNPAHIVLPRTGERRSKKSVCGGVYGKARDRNRPLSTLKLLVPRANWPAMQKTHNLKVTRRHGRQMDTIEMS
jgi:hypothetical protein